VRKKETLASRYGPWALIAGASEGIGRAFAEHIAAAGIHLVLVARRTDALERTAADIREAYGVEVRAVSADLGGSAALEAISSCAADIDVGLLVYNACYSHIGDYMEQSLASKMATIDVNCRGPVMLTSFFAERMIKRGRGGIILMSSMAGFQGSKLVGIYGASKAFNTTLGEALWVELKPKGVDVLVCVAGATLTPNFKAQTPEAKRKHAFPSPPDAVARAGIANLGKRPVCIAGAVNRLARLITMCMPRRLAVSFMAANTEKLYT
jgi:short-subunit dehydrogenase